MKLNAALARTLLMAASIGMVVPVLAAAPASKGKKPGAAQPDSGPQVTPTPAPVDPSKIVIPGTVLERKKGGYLSLTLEGGNFKLGFYDADKKEMPADAPKATARWNPKQKFGEDRTVLIPTADGLALKGSRFVRPPFPIMVYVTLLDANGAGTENYIFNFKP